MKTKQERSEIFKLFQSNIKKKDSFETGKQHLLTLRADFSAIYDYLFQHCDDDDFSKMPFKNSKTIAYYLFHLMRIEDIVSNTLISGKDQLFFSQGFDKLLHSPIITTGNELKGDDIVAFSKKINVQQLNNYTAAAMANTNALIHDMTFERSKTPVPEERKTALIQSKTVSEDTDAFWLVDYWCKKTYAGLFLMPFSRHHMMHIDVCLRIGAHRP